MSSTPLWVPLIVAAIGLCGTAVAGLGGVWVTQHRADKRESVAWRRELERESARWKREDEARTYEQRRDAYVTFYQAAYEYKEQLEAYGRLLGTDTPLPLTPSRDDLRKARNLMAIYGSPKVQHAATTVYTSAIALRLAWRIARQEPHAGGAAGRLAREIEGFEKRLESALGLIRSELGVPNDPADTVP
ncbi:hypothetical protein [Mycolicibacterium aichiense]|uniref:Uncharacterized protein n=1 Tax=Mycolicibacterium aichiense TaxID=1799 RepID=A0AAD1HJ76_9MYCO|nr:hypothetical protein [Mycolicibacterium aichiense]MCV7017981.1 hypothetical protein [Mycolicibacterium aichiense]BBX06402.1 hypothetical protein MAIC_12050 [Mycolicibacterium aichiense]